MRKVLRTGDKQYSLFWVFEQFWNVLANDSGFWYRDVPSSAALPIIRPALGRQDTMSDRAKTAMQGYLNHFLGNINIVNSPEVLFVHTKLKI